MERLSVKKPFTVLVAAIIIIAMGFVSLTHLSMDLLPEIDLPYLIVITAYPGASPEKIEDTVTVPIENTLGTINGVKNVSSSSSDDYSVVQLEFEDGTDMNAATVRVSGALNQLESSLPEGTMTPNILEISLDMFATMYVAVEREGYDIYELTDFVNYEVIPYISRQDGVASVTTVGLVEKSIQVELNQDKIDDLNEDILEETNDALADAQDMLDDANEALEEAQTELDSAQASFGDTFSSALFSQLNLQSGDMADDLKDGIATLRERLSALSDGLDSASTSTDASLSTAQERVDSTLETLNAAIKLQTDAQEILAAAQENADTTQTNLDASTFAHDSEEYLALLQAVTDAQTDLTLAQETYDAASEEVASAQADYDDAVDALTQASMEGLGLTPEQAALLIADINDLNDDLDDASDNINGDSVTDLVTTTTDLASLLTRASLIISQIRAADPLGSMADSLDNADASLAGMNEMVDSIPAMLTGLQTMTSGLTQAQLDAAVGFSTAAIQLSDAQTQLDAAQAQYDAAREEALKNANVDDFITPQTLSQLIYAQNFSMPIGYIDDQDDNSWLLRVGDEFGSEEDIASSLLMDNDIIGTVRLEDIADITIIDNADDSYTKLNGSDGIILCVYKSSSAGTNDVSKLCNEAFETLAEEYPGMHTINLVDQGIYINMIVESVFQSIIIGALLAIVILALFLKDVKPTIVVAISIPLSVLLAIVLMYFTGLELNMMTLSGLALGIGMLVDNSVVVMENIFRLRGKGLPAPRAAVQGAKQVRGSIIASTLTTVCVFFPAVFASGTVKSLLYPLALSVGYCLVASLVIAMSVVPASCSTIMKNTVPKEHKLFDRMLEGYGKTLSWCLRFKVVPLVIAVSLLAFSVYEVLRMGIVYIPEMTTNELNITIVTPEEMTREESYLKVDEIMDDILSVKGIEDIGVMDSGSTSSFLMAGTSDGSYGTYICYAVADEKSSAEDIAEIGAAIEKATADSGCEVTVEAGSMGSMSSMMGSSGVSVQIFGNNYDELERISGDIRAIMEDQEGLTEVHDSFGEGDPTLQVIVDRDEAMRYGLTVAQIYAGIAGHTSTSVTATTVTIDGTEMKVNIVDNTDTITKEDLMDIEFEEVDMTGGASGSADYSDMASAFEDMTGEDEETSEENEEAEEPEEEEEEKITTHTLSEFAEVIETTSSSSISRENLTRYVTVSASVEDGYNATLISRELEPKLDDYQETLEKGYSVEISGESTEVMEMVVQMLEMAALALLFIYLIMVAQFQSLLSPLIILFTIPLAFTGGLIGLLITGIPLSMLSLLGFVVLMGTVVNNGIVFVDYANQLRIGGLERREALVATGITRMRPILMTALTTILAMSMMIFGNGMSAQLGRGMAVVISAGLLYATFMTLFIVPVMYDILFKKQPLNVDVGSDLDEAIDDAADYLLSHGKA